MPGSTVDIVKEVVVRTLGIEARADSIGRDTLLLDSIPEFDSMAVLQVILAIEERFEIEIDNQDVTGEIFESIKTLAEFVESTRK